MQDEYASGAASFAISNVTYALVHNPEALCKFVRGRSSANLDLGVQGGRFVGLRKESHFFPFPLTCARNPPSAMIIRLDHEIGLSCSASPSQPIVVLTVWNDHHDADTGQVV